MKFFFSFWGVRVKADSFSLLNSVDRFRWSQFLLFTVQFIGLSHGLHQELARVAKCPPQPGQAQKNLIIMTPQGLFAQEVLRPQLSMACRGE